MTLKPNWAVHPGEILAEVIEEQNLTQRIVSKATGISEAYLSQIINGSRPMSAETARRLESLGITRSFWMGLQRNHDDAIARKEGR